MATTRLTAPDGTQYDVEIGPLTPVRQEFVIKNPIYTMTFIREAEALRINLRDASSLTSTIWFNEPYQELIDWLEENKPSCSN